MAAPHATTGFFGKVVSHGDFVANRFDRDLRALFDGWLQRSIEHSRRSLGRGWADDFEAMPIWRFVLTPDLIGREAYAGLMAPSRDRVGRHFPLMICAGIAEGRNGAKGMVSSEAWFEEAEQLLLRERKIGFQLDRFTAALDLLPSPQMPRQAADGRSLWWTAAGDAGRQFSATGLPAPENFVRFLGAEHAGANIPAVQPQRENPPTELGLRAAGGSHAGTRLRIDATALTKGGRRDLNALAQGWGEGTAAGLAASLVIERLERIAPSATIDNLISHAKGALGDANTLLRGAIGLSGPQSAETSEVKVVVLLTTGARYAAVWAGDLRCYLLRDGLMQPLTRDHVEPGLQRRLSRSVGGWAQMAPEVAGGVLRARDRFLLIGADTVRLLGEREIAARLAQPGIEDVPLVLIEDALIAGAGDNIGTLVVEIEATGDRS